MNETIKSCDINLYTGILLLSSFRNIGYGKSVSQDPRIESQVFVISKGLNLAQWPSTGMIIDSPHTHHLVLDSNFQTLWN